MTRRTLLRLSLLSLLICATCLQQSIAETKTVARESAPPRPRHTIPASSASSVSSSSSIPAAVPAAVREIRKPESSIELLLDQQKNLLPEHRKAILEITDLLPASCQNQIKNLYIRYDFPTERGLAGSDTVIVSGDVRLPEFRALLTHEILGHVLDLGCLQGTAQSGASAFRDGSTAIENDDPSVLFYGISWATSKVKKPDAQESDFVSGYAFQADAFEDLAESVTFYLLHRQEFERLAQTNPVLMQKFQWISTYAFPNTRDLATSDFRWDASQIPWDTTKLPYAWTGTTGDAVAAK